MMRNPVYPLLIALILVAGGCANSASPDVYPRHQVRKAYTVYDATIVDMRVVRIEGNHTRLGTLGGAWIGAASAGSLGDGRGSRVAGAVGGVAGAIVGQAVERKVKEEEGIEYLLELDKGQTVAVVQGDDVRFTVGERVRVLRDGGSARVVKRR